MTQKTPNVEILTERTKLIAGREQTVDVLIRISLPEPDQSETGRPPLNLSLVLDRSGSMSGAKIARAREAANFCIDQMLPTDRLSVVTFDDHIDMLFPNQPVTNKQMMKDLIGRVEARGSTALHEAWVRGGLTVTEDLLERGLNRVILITDGLANVGIVNTDEIVSQSLGLFQRGVSTSTIGIGDDFNEELLMPMAQAGGGNAWHAAEPEDLQRIFRIELEGLVSLFARNVSLGLIPADGIRLVDQLNDFKLTETGRYQLPNLSAGLQLDVVVQLKVPAHAEGETIRLLDLRLGYMRPDADSAEVIRLGHDLEFASTAQVDRLPQNQEVIKAVRFLMNARARHEAMFCLDVGDFTGADLALASAVSSTRLACASMANSPAVMEECGALEDVRESLKDRVQLKMSRKRLAYAAYSRSTGKSK